MTFIPLMKTETVIYPLRDPRVIPYNFRGCLTMATVEHYLIYTKCTCLQTADDMQTGNHGKVLMYFKRMKSTMLI